MLCIRLQRLGKKKQPTYRFVVSEKGRDTQGKSTEIVGFFNPLAKENQYELKRDRIEYWLSTGAQPSETVHNILVAQGIIEGKKKGPVSISKKRQGKMEAKAAAVAKEAEAKKAAAAKAEADAAAAKAAAAEAAEAAAKAAAEAAQAPAETPAEAPAEVVEAPKAEETAQA